MASGVSSAPPKGKVAQGSLSSLAAFPPRRGLGGAVRGNSDDSVGGAARIRTRWKSRRAEERALRYQAEPRCPQGRRREAGYRGSVEQKCEPMNKKV